MAVELPAEHSPLGGSATHRYMECAGSVALGFGHTDEQSDFATEGQAAHSVAEHALEGDLGVWRFVGGTYYEGKLYAPKNPRADNKPFEGGVSVTPEMVAAVSTYIEALADWHPVALRHQGNTWVEKPFHCPDLHPLYWGKADFVFIEELPDGTLVLHVWDYKHGAGIVVEVERNPQLMYYGCGILEELQLWQTVDKVVLHIAQPRAPHYDGPLRHWETTPTELEEWLDDELLPAMDRAMVSRDTKSGGHCRFCPVRFHACPQLLKDMEELEKLVKKFQGKKAQELSTKDIARFLDLYDVAKIVWKAAEKTAFNRLNAGKPVPGRKLGPKRANRIWRDEKEAKRRLKKRYGKKAFAEPELKSPAQIDTLPEGEKFTAALAFKPDTGLTVVPASDTRPEVSRSTKSMFEPVKKATAKKGKK